jgi:hypothetical protein
VRLDQLANHGEPESQAGPAEIHRTGFLHEQMRRELLTAADRSPVAESTLSLRASSADYIALHWLE